MKRFRSITTGMLLASAAVSMSAAPPALARPPCDGSPGACFVELLDKTGAFFGPDEATGWGVYWIANGGNDYGQFRPNGDVLLHIVDQEVALIAISDNEPEWLFGTGRISINAFFDPATVQFTCPTTARIEGTVGGRWLESIVQILPAETKDDLGPWHAAPECYLQKFVVAVGP